MRVMVISASGRASSQSLKVSNWLVDHAGKLGYEASLLDLHQTALPIYDDAEHSELTPKINTLKSKLDSAEAYIFVSPEWNGMMSLNLANMFQYIDQEMAHKPVMLVGVSAGRGGTYPVAQMRLMGHKNRHYILSPESLIVSGVDKAFNDNDFSEKAVDLPLKKRADYALKVLCQYAKALNQVRSSGVIDHENFANGV